MRDYFDAELKTDVLHRSLTSGWHMRLLAGPAPRGVSGQLIPTSRPGAIHQDLASAGLLATTSADWISHCGWEYSLDFPWRRKGKRSTKLIFHGLTRSASASINGHALGSSPGREPVLHDVDALLLNGINTLKIILSPAASSGAGNS